MELPYSDRYWTSPDGLKLHYREYSAAEAPPLIDRLYSACTA